MPNILKEKLYFNNIKSRYQKRLNKEIEENLVNYLRKLLDYLVNEYYEHTSNKMGLESYKGGKEKYREIVKFATLND